MTKSIYIYFTVIFLSLNNCECVLADIPMLQEPFKVESSKGVIETEYGHSHPFFIDVNGDDLKDLVVGEYGDPFGGAENATTTKAKKPTKNIPYSGRARIYLNTGTSKKPKFEEYRFLQADNKDARINTRCCIGFDPCFVDLNGDGQIDLVAGGEYWNDALKIYEGVKGKSLRFIEGVKLKQKGLFTFQSH